jgi:hypothetical protein
MIIEPTESNGINTISNNGEKYCFCCYDKDNNISHYQEELVTGMTQASCDMFGADTLKNLDKEIKKRKLIFKTVEE